MMETQQTFTESALVDRIKESWRMSKTSEFPIPGDYFYQIIDQGILFGDEIEIPLSFFNKELREILNREKTYTIQKVIFRTISEIAHEKFGSRNLTERIKWRFV